MSGKVSSPCTEFSPSAPQIYQSVMDVIDSVLENQSVGRYLDIGSGDGLLLQLVGDRFGLERFGCDHTNRFAKWSNVPIDIVDLDREPLPYPADHFSLVTCVETIEHLENFREMIREIYRVLRPGGWAVVTTPNVLNLRSRLRYLTSGFHNMFGPLAISGQRMHDTHGHISPVGWFYLAHAMLKTGFENLQVRVDRFQRRSIIALVFLYLPIRLLGRFFLYLERRTNIQSITPENEPLVRQINTLDLLLGRTLIVAAQKAH